MERLRGTSGKYSSGGTIWVARSGNGNSQFLELGMMKTSLSMSPQYYLLSVGVESIKKVLTQEIMYFQPL